MAAAQVFFLATDYTDKHRLAAFGSNNLATKEHEFARKLFV
jgi:hypothetical protein